MEKFINSNQIGSFVQAMADRGIYVSVDKTYVSVEYPKGNYEHIRIARLLSNEELVNWVDKLSKDAESDTLEN